MTQQRDAPSIATADGVPPFPKRQMLILGEFASDRAKAMSQAKLEDSIVHLDCMSLTLRLS